MKVYCGTLVHCLTPQRIQVLHDHLIGFEENECGKIVFVENISQLDTLCQEHGFDKDSVHRLTDSQFLMPGLVDTHIHAPQYVNSGTGYDRMLLDWLDTYTFPTEAKFKDKEMATDVYPKVVNQTLKHGTTTAAYFATIHLEASFELCRAVAKAGQRALVGKLNMDQESPDYYVEDTQQSLDETKMFIEGVREMKNHLIQPIITPRFAPTCSPPLLKGLGELALNHDVHIQSHICEQQPEVEYTLNLFPEHEHCASIFDRSGLLTNKTVMAHCIYLNDTEIKLFKEIGVGIAHCPSSNFCICSGILNTRRMLDLGMKIGLGTDVSGGYSPSIFDAMRKSVEASKALSFTKPDGYKAISHHEALYMATIGGAQALTLDSKIGNFVVGKEFDALLVDVKAPNPQPVFDIFDQDSFDDILMKYLYLGDDRNLLKRFVAGKEITLA